MRQNEENEEKQKLNFPPKILNFSQFFSILKIEKLRIFFSIDVFLQWWPLSRNFSQFSPSIFLNFSHFFVLKICVVEPIFGRFFVFLAQFSQFSEVVSFFMTQTPHFFHPTFSALFTQVITTFLKCPLEGLTFWVLTSLDLGNTCSSLW